MGQKQAGTSTSCKDGTAKGQNNYSCCLKPLHVGVTYASIMTGIEDVIKILALDLVPLGSEHRFRLLIMAYNTFRISILPSSSGWNFLSQTTQQLSCMPSFNFSLVALYPSYHSGACLPGKCINEGRVVTSNQNLAIVSIKMESKIKKCLVEPFLHHLSGHPLIGYIGLM